jgi:hypothetical protein
MLFDIVAMLAARPARTLISSRIPACRLSGTFPKILYRIVAAVAAHDASPPRSKTGAARCGTVKQSVRGRILHSFE